MKRIIKILVLLSTLLLLASCQGGNTTNSKNAKTQQQDIPIIKEKSVNSKNDILVVYFSANDGVSEDANIIKDYLFADMMELVPTEPYTKDDLDISNPNSRIMKESNDDTIRPTIANPINNIDKYNWIFLGFPVWQGKMPKIVYTFLEKYNFKDKYIFSFCKNGNNEIELENIRNDISALTDNTNDGQAFIYPIKNFNNGELVENITDWIDWCNPITEYDEGLIPETVVVTETEEPDLSEGLSINNY